MGLPNSGSSIYHEVQALYWHNLDGNLLAIEGKASQEVEKAWPHVWKVLESRPSDRTELVLSSGGQAETVELTLSHLDNADDRGALETAISQLSKGSEDATIRIQELRRPSEQRIIGTLSIIPASDQQTPEFRDWAGLFILSETRFLPHRHLGDDRSENAEARAQARRITDVFEEKLQNVAPNDQWISGGGRTHFEDRVYGFTERHARVEFCLPAFPCKSSNKEKTIGSYPDRAEEIALDALRVFIRSVATIYEPGAKVIIISDGHVFSDCSKFSPLHLIPGRPCDRLGLIIVD
jgi:Pyoverdine/dityrosine biosynthesis protein